MKAILVLAFLSTNVLAETKKFYCKAEAILEMDFVGQVENGKLVSDLGVIIEGSFFDVKKEDVKEFWNKETSKGHEFGFLVNEEATEYWIDLKTIDFNGTVSTDYRGITLNESNVYCEFESLL